MNPGDLALVAAVFALLVATAALTDAARRVARRLWPGEPVATALGTLLFLTAAVVTELQVMGIAGLLQPPALLAVALATWLAAVRFAGPRRLSDGHLQQPAGAGSVPGAATPGMTAAVVVVAGALVALLAASYCDGLLHPRPAFDALSGHLPVPAQWLLAGNIRLLPQVSPVTLNAAYPGNSELLSLWLMVFPHRDFLVQPATLPAVGMLVVAIYLAATELGAPRLVALAAALVIPTAPRYLGELVATNMEDMFAAAAVAAALAFTVHYRRHQDVASVFAAGVAVGLAGGARYAAVLPALLVTGLLLLELPPPRRVRQIVLFAVPAVLLSAYWYIRNAAWTGDPVFPQSVPWRHVSGPTQLFLPATRSYLQLGIRPSAWASGTATLLGTDGPVVLALLLLAPLPIVLAVRRRRAAQMGAAGSRRTARDLAWAVLPLAAVATYVITPAGAGAVINGRVDTFLQALNLRYLLLSLPFVAVSVAPLAAGLRVAAQRGLAVAVMATALVATLVMSEAMGTLQSRHLGLVPLAAGMSLAAGLIAVGRGLWSEGAAAGRGPSPVAGAARRGGAGAGAVLAVGLVAFAAGAPALAAHHDRGRIASGMSFAAAAAHLGPSNSTVDVAGMCQTYAFYGPDIGHQVLFLSGADGGFEPPVAADYESWLRSLRQHRVDVVVLGRDSCFYNVDVPQEGWIRDHPEVFAPGFSGRGATVYRVLGST